MRIRVLTLAVAVLLALLALPSRTEACSCVSGAPICETFWKTPLVFSGTVLEIATDTKSDPRITLGRSRVVRFHVTQAWRGEATGTIEIHTGMGGGDCGYKFVEGRQYLVFASGAPGQYSTGICSRTRRLSEAADDLEYLETALQPSAAGRIFGTATYARRTGEVSPRPVAGYTVTLTHKGTQRTTTTGNDGRYEFRGVPAGVYAVALTVPGTGHESDPKLVKLVDPRGCAAADFYLTDGRISARPLEPSPLRR